MMTLLCRCETGQSMPVPFSPSCPFFSLFLSSKFYSLQPLKRIKASWSRALIRRLNEARREGAQQCCRERYQQKIGGYHLAAADSVSNSSHGRRYRRRIKPNSPRTLIMMSMHEDGSGTALAAADVEPKLFSKRPRSTLFTPVSYTHLTLPTTPYV